MKPRPAYFAVKLGASGQTVTKPGGFTEREADEFAATHGRVTSNFVIPVYVVGPIQADLFGGAA